MVTVPECTDCAYQAIQIGSDWYASTDYETHQTSLTKAQSVVDPDGMLRYVISEQNPGIANWLETTGHRTGPIMLRWQRLERDLGPEDGPTVEKVALADVPDAAAALLPRDPRGVRRADRRPAALRGPKDAVVTVPLLAGQGGRPVRRRPRPRPLARRGGGAGWAPTWCSSRRTERRLEKMAEVVRSHGRRALVVPTDITDEDARTRLVETALAEFGRVDCLINNAFGIPPMDPLTTLDLQSLRDANETNVFAPLRLSALFADALAASPNGSVIMLNSCVLYSSQPEYSGYKLSKGALAHLASSLATELGPRGIRVNSVAPSYIYEDVNKAYFDWLASEQGVTHEDVYRREGRADRPQAAGDARRGGAGRAVPRPPTSPAP